MTFRTNGLFVRMTAFAAVALVAVCLASPAQAQSACDPEYMEAMEARAWAEAQREVAMNASIIAKPDSVLEYSCFGQFLDNLAGDDGLFSEAGCCGDVAPIPDSSLTDALNDIVMTSVNSYLGSNFGTPALGGRNSGAASIKTNPTFPNGISSQPCISMNAIWQVASCANFLQDSRTPANRGRFFDLGWFASNDPREYPACNTTPTPQSLVNAQLPVAYNGAAKVALYAANSNTATTAPYTEDPPSANAAAFWNAMRSLTAPYCTGSTCPAGSLGSCGAPIYTGLLIMQAGGASGWTPAARDGICVNPGCHYVPGSSATANGSCAP